VVHDVKNSATLMSLKECYEMTDEFLYNFFLHSLFLHLVNENSPGVEKML